MIFGIRQSSQDANAATKQVETIFNKIGIEPRVIAHSRRFRQTDPNTPAPIFVRLSKGTDRYKVIAAAKKLRSVAEFRNVFINPDRTEAERRRINEIKAYGVTNEMSKWFENFLSCRKQRLLIGETSSRWTDLLSGVP